MANSDNNSSIESKDCTYESSRQCERLHVSFRLKEARSNDSVVDDDASVIDSRSSFVFNECESGAYVFIDAKNSSVYYFPNRFSLVHKMVFEKDANSLKS